MKKIMAFILAAVMCFSLVACGSKEPTFEGLQKEIYDAAKAIGCEEVTSGYEYSLADFELKDGSKQAFDVLLLVADGTPYIVDREDGKVYAEADVPQDFEVDNGMPLFADKGDIFSMLVLFEMLLENNGMVWTEYETLTEIESADLDAVNAALTK